MQRRTARTRDAAAETVGQARQDRSRSEEAEIPTILKPMVLILSMSPLVMPGVTLERRVYRRGATPKLVATIPVGDLPHGVWGSGDGTRVYVGLENQDEVVAIDALTNTVIATIPVGQQPQALVYVPNAVPEGEGTTNLTSLGESGQATHLTMTAPVGSARPGHATVSVNDLGSLDLLQVAVSGLQPGQTYRLWLVTSRTAPFGRKQALVAFQTNLAGAQVAQTLGLFRDVLNPGREPAADSAQRRYLLLTRDDNDTPELVQGTP